MSDKFFTQDTCDRCFSSLAGQARKMSWFTEDCLCESCSTKEGELRSALRKEGSSDSEGCGFIPKLKNNGGN